MSDAKIYFKKKDYDLLYQKYKREFELSEMHPLQKDWGVPKKKEAKQAKLVKQAVSPLSNPLSNNPLSRLGKKPEAKPVPTIPQNQPPSKETPAGQEESNIKKDAVSPWMLIRG